MNPKDRRTILFFAPFHYRSRDNESVMIKMREMGHRVLFLSLTDGRIINDFLRHHGVECFAMNSRADGWRVTIKQVFFLVNFIWSKKVDIVFSHLEPANFVAVLAQYFVKARVVIVRHHSDLFQLGNIDRLFSYRFTYRNARHILAVSNHSKNVMVAREGVAADKISVINLSYNFGIFDLPDLPVVERIRSAPGSGLLLLTAGRLIKTKRTEMSVAVLKTLRQKGLDTHLIIAGDGTLRNVLEATIDAFGMRRYCFLEGHKSNIMDYLAACDILLHPSESESSSVIIKEAGLQRKVVIACRGVGDCDEYIINGINGFLLDKDHFETAAVDIIATVLQDAETRRRIGDALYETIQSRFNVDNNIHLYEKFFE